MLMIYPKMFPTDGKTKCRVLHVKLRPVRPSIRQPSLKMADRIEGLRTKHVKKWACTHVSNLPNNDSDWPVSMYSMYHASSRHAAYRSSTHWPVVYRDSAQVYLCLLLKQFVYQSSYFSTLAGAMQKMVRTVKGISLVNDLLSDICEIKNGWQYEWKSWFWDPVSGYV